MKLQNVNEMLSEAVESLSEGFHGWETAEKAYKDFDKIAPALAKSAANDAKISIRGLPKKSGKHMSIIEWKTTGKDSIRVMMKPEQDRFKITVAILEYENGGPTFSFSSVRSGVLHVADIGKATYAKLKKGRG